MNIKLESGPAPFRNSTAKRISWKRIYAVMESGEWFVCHRDDVDRVRRGACLHLGKGNYTCRRHEHKPLTYVMMKK